MRNRTRTTRSMKELIMKNKEELLKNKGELEQIEQRMDARFSSTPLYSTTKLNITPTK